jgi:serine/threonine protein kinase/tetratricopeptide (TPR) repeat protein
MLKTVGHYTITGTLGEGGMGIVYAARDERLNRTVALKMIRREISDPAATDRLRREARAAATVNHPNICQLYDIGGDEELYIAMELLEGESLASRLARGPLALGDAASIALAMLSALEAVHGHGLMHRDLKPSNIFITAHGVKLLDFGLARPIDVEQKETRLTMPGTMLGTPQYLSPEQLLGRPVDSRADLFAAGSVLYEMLTGQPPFKGNSVAEVVHAIVYEQPPALGGSPAVAAIDRIIHKAIAKRPEDRYASAAAMGDDLRAAMLLIDSGAVSRPPRPMTRLIVLPFRLLRPDADIDFLAFSLSDALTTSLSGLDSLLVRSSLTASRFAAEPVDLEMVAARADVDCVLTGTLLRAEDQLRVTAQLVEVPSETVRWSQAMQVRLGDVFQVQDELTSRIVESLAVPLSARDEAVLRHDVPSTAKAYEFYLRANQLAYQAQNWAIARDLYLRSLEEDSNYAPAWARLARIYRLIGMYSGDAAEDAYALAEQAFRRALELNPDLPIAHNLYTAVELETGRAREAMLRLLERARLRSADPELFAGLVQACRYEGLQRPAIAAYEHARRLEPQARTAVSHAYLMAGEHAKAVEADLDDPPVVSMLALDLMGRHDDAAAHARRELASSMPPLLRAFFGLCLALFEGRRADAIAAGDAIAPQWAVRDPCATYYVARALARAEHPEAIAMLKRSVQGGFHSYPFFARDPWLEPVRHDAAVAEILGLAERGHRDAAAAFVAAGGERLLGPLQRE